MRNIEVAVLQEPSNTNISGFGHSLFPVVWSVEGLYVSRYDCL